MIDTLAGGVGFLPKGSEDPNRSVLSVLLKKSSDEVPLKGSLSLKGSPPNGSRKKKRPKQWEKQRLAWLSMDHPQPIKTNNHPKNQFSIILHNLAFALYKNTQEGIQTCEGVGLEGILCLERVCWRLLSTAVVVEHGYLWLERVVLMNEPRNRSSLS